MNPQVAPQITPMLFSVFQDVCVYFLSAGLICICVYFLNLLILFSSCCIEQVGFTCFAIGKSLKSAEIVTIRNHEASGIPPGFILRMTYVRLKIFAIILLNSLISNPGQLKVRSLTSTRMKNSFTFTRPLCKGQCRN